LSGSNNAKYPIETLETKKNLLYIPRYKISRLQTSIKYLRVKMWNKIPLKFKTQISNYI